MWFENESLKQPQSREDSTVGSESSESGSSPSLDRRKGKRHISDLICDRRRKLKQFNAPQREACDEATLEGSSDEDGLEGI